MCSSKLVGTSTIRDMACYLCSECAERPGVAACTVARTNPPPNPLSSCDTTCGRCWKNWAFNICSHFRAEEALHHREDCSKISWEQHPSMGISGDGSYHAYVFSLPPSAPVHVTEYLPLIAEGLAHHPLFLLFCQPTICTLVHKFNLNQIEKKGHIKKVAEWHLDLLGATRDEKDYRIKWCKRRMDLCTVQCPSTMSFFSVYDLTLYSKSCREVVVVICSWDNLTVGKRISANVARYENNF